MGLRMVCIMSIRLSARMFGEKRLEKQEIIRKMFKRDIKCKYSSTLSKKFLWVVVNFNNR